MIDFEELRQLLHVFLGGLGLAVEERGDGHFIAANVLGNGFKTQVLPFLGLEKGWRRCRQSGDQRSLPTMLLQRAERDSVGAVVYIKSRNWVVLRSELASHSGCRIPERCSAEWCSRARSSSGARGKEFLIRERDGQAVGYLFARGLRKILVMDRHPRARARRENEDENEEADPRTCLFGIAGRAVSC